MALKPPGTTLGALEEHQDAEKGAATPFGTACPKMEITMLAQKDLQVQLGQRVPTGLAQFVFPHPASPS